MKAPIEFDVLITGAGPAGVVLARLLGNAGVRTLLIDRETDVMRIPRAIALDDDGGRVLQAVGDYARVRHGMPRIERVRMRSPTVGDVFSYDANCWRNGNPMILMFRQPELEDALREGLARTPNVTFRQGVSLEGFNADDHGVSARLVNESGSEYVHARYLVGCDGARSTVRKLLGVEMIGSTYEQDWLVIDVRHDPMPNREVHFLCDPDRPGVTMPAPDGGRRWEFMLGERDERATITSPDVLARLLSPWGDVKQMDVERAAVYTFHARVAQHFQRGRVFLAGDAAHLTPPFAGQGLMAGLRDAHNLAWKLAAVLRGAANDSLLETYEVERLPNARTMVRFAQLMGEIIMARDPARCFFRDQMLRRIGRLPGLRSITASVEIKPRTRINEGLLLEKNFSSQLNQRLTTRLSVRKSALRAGDLLPQCTLQLPAAGFTETQNGKTLLLDEHLGYHWALIGIDVDPQRHLRRDQQAWWKQLGSVLTISSNPHAANASDNCARDLEGELARSERSGFCLIARPDRHLYAVVRANALERAIDTLAAQLGNTGLPEDSTASPALAGN